MRYGSLKGRLVGWTTLAVATVWLMTMAFSYFEARHEVEEMLDAHLAQVASILVVQAGQELDDIETEHAPLLHKYARRVAFQVFDEHGRLGLHSVNAPNTPLAAADGFSEALVDGRRWRVFTAQGREFTVHVGEDAEAREDVARELVIGMLQPALLAIPLLALVLWIGVGRGLKPLARTAGEVATRAPDNLAPLTTDGMPDEVRPLAERLNELFAGLAKAIERERQFTADAAHELRTPLAAIRAQAQVALGADDPGQRRHALDAVLQGCDRAARLVEQLLTLSRIDHAPLQPAVPVLLQEVAAEVIGEAAEIAIRKGIELELDAGGDGALGVVGHRDLIRILLRNLIDNALRYTQAGGQVRVSLRASPSAVILAVSDNGPGIPASERERATQRFYRLLGSGEEGSGLGLSIAARIAELHGARLELGDAPGGRGLRATVGFPAG